MKSTKGKLVLFGAGKIGRSFIGQLFSTGGYEVVFIDIYKPVIDELNSRRGYDVIVKSEKDSLIRVKNVRGIYSCEEQEVANEIASANILAVSVGLNALPSVFPLIARGLGERYTENKTRALDIIIAENMANAPLYFKEHLKTYLPDTYPISSLLGFIETSIGKMVPLISKEAGKEDLLRVYAEPYNTLILGKKEFRNPIPDIKGLALKENMKAWVDRKLFIHNLGHASTAYLGYLHNPELVYIYEALEIPEVYVQVKATMLQSADILMLKYPGEFTQEDLNEHIIDLLNRFQNKALGDTIYRVGCDLTRKLSANDRLAGAIKSAISLKLPYDKILYALVCGYHFRAKNENGTMLDSDIGFVELYQDDLAAVLNEICGFEKSVLTKLFQEAEVIDKQLSIFNSPASC